MELFAKIINGFEAVNYFFKSLTLHVSPNSKYVCVYDIIAFFCCYFVLRFWYSATRVLTQPGYLSREELQ